MEPSSVKRRLTCILAADAVGYSKQMGQDEEGTIRVLSAHRAVIDGIIAFHQGRIVSTAGDSVLAEFGSAVEAVRCAVEIQDALRTRNDSLPADRKMLFRVGVNLGDVVVKNDDLLGDGVNVASRLETMAEPGGICIASSVYDQITGKLDLGFQDIGDQQLKNISRPIHVYRVSGAVPPFKVAQVQEPLLAAPLPARRPSVPWSITAVLALLLGAVVWQAGWLRTAPTPQMMPATQMAPAPAAVATNDSALVEARVQAQRLRDEAQAIRDQAKAELEKAKTQVAQAPVKPKAAPEGAAPVRAVPAPSPVVPAAPVKPSPPQATALLPAEAAPSQLFDGNWDVSIHCPDHESGASGYVLDFTAKVRNGMLRGERGNPGEPGWISLSGEIGADGNAELMARGLTNDPKYTVNHSRQGAEYNYPVKAVFQGARGTGKRQKLRVCDLSFNRQ